MRVRDARLRGRSRSVAAKAREKRLRDNSVENSVKHFQFNANLRKLFGELGQIFLTETVPALNFQIGKNQIRLHSANQPIWKFHLPRLAKPAEAVVRNE